jgi:4-amino-4-deoxy-L-arabinose transferase-like glycosyltransferase
MLGFLKKYFFPISLTFVLSAYFFFGFQHLTQFITADEHYWIYERIPQYWNAIGQGKWGKTFINDKPGVSIALVSGIGLLFEPHPEEHLNENDNRILIYDTAHTESLYYTFRLPILIINGLLLIYLFWVVARLTNPWIALWTTILTTLSPILLGISQIVNPDSLLWSFGAAAIFSFLTLLKSQGKKLEKKFLWLTILFTGLTLLSKYTALILFPFYLALIMFRFLHINEATNETSRVTIRKTLVQWVLIILGSLAFLCFFLPALLVSPSALDTLLLALPNKLVLFSSGGIFLTMLIVDTTIFQNKLIFCVRSFYQRFIAPLLYTIPLLFLGIFLLLIIVRNFFTEWDIFTLIPFDIKNLSDARYITDIPNFFEAFILEWNPLVFSLTPIALFGFITLLIIILFNKIRKEHAFIIYPFFFFFLLYFILLIYSNVLTTPRYSIMLYPLFAFLSALGIWYIIEKVAWAYKKLGATLVILFASLSSLIAIKPFYFNYTNFLLPKAVLINDAWGYGGYEAAQYLNGLPDARNLTVWIDYYGVCEFFVGKCLDAYTFNPNVVRPDYYVLTRRGQIRYIPRYLRWEEKSGLTAYKYYDIQNPDWQLFIDGRPGNFIKVVKVIK